MSFLIGEIVANVRADSGQFRSEIRNVERTGATASRNTQRSLDGIGRKFASLALIAKTLFTSTMVMGARNAVREFAYLEGAMAKFNVVFGEQAREVEAWVDQFRKGVPLARREIIATAASMQDLLVPMGMAREDATEMTKEWLELSAALAAFNDVPVDQALEAIRSGIAGQRRPLRQFGIDVRETALQQVALEEGLIKSGEAMGDVERQQALLIQAYRQSQDALNGYEDQLGTTLMLEQELSATFKDTQAVIGQGLQPAYNELLKTLTELIKSYAEFQLAAEGFITVVNLSKEAIDDLEKSTGVLSVGLGVITKAYNELNNVLGFNMVKQTAKDWFEFYQNIGRSRSMLETFTQGVVDYQNAVDGGFSPDDLIVSEEQVQKLSDVIAHLKERVEAVPPLDIVFDDDGDLINRANRHMEEFGTTFEEAMQAVRSAPPDFEAFMDAVWGSALSTKELEHRLEAVTDSSDDATGAARFFSRTLADGLDQVLFRARSVEDAIKGIVRQLASRALTTGLMALLGGGLPEGMSFGRAMFGKQAGGPVMGGGAYLVGEQGPELFLPQSSGTIVPNDTGSKTVNVNVRVSGGTRFDGKDLRYVIDEQVRQSVRLQ